MRSSRKEGRGGRVNQRTAGRSRSRSRSRAISRADVASGSPPAPYPKEHSRLYISIVPPFLFPRARSFLLCERETSSIFESFSEIAIVLFVSALLPAAVGRRRIGEEEGLFYFISVGPRSLLPPSFAQPVSAIDSLCVVVSCI